MLMGMNILPLLLASLTLAAAEVRSLTVATPDGPRNMLVALPSSGAAPGRPLVLLFHGHMGNAKNTLGQGLGDGSALAAWLPIADREGLIVVALDGAKGTDHKQGWNDGRPGSAGNPTTDDVAYARAVIARIQQEWKSDPARIFAMGMSNGGVFTFRLALELDQPMAGIAAACASMPGDRAPALTSRKTSVLLIEGTEDPLMPYAGGQVHFHDQLRGAVLGTETTLAYWRTANGLHAAPTVQELPHRERKDPTRVTRQVWGASGGPQVALLKVTGGGHCEPSLTHRYGWLYTKVCGKQNADMESAEEAWAFFKDKRAPSAPAEHPAR
jgi:polyhydroxybutyrate depolymerase